MKIDQSLLNSTCLTESNPDRHFRMCLLDDSNKPVTKFVTCKDFIQLIPWAIVNKTSIKEYGFEFDGSGYNLDTFRFRLYALDEHAGKVFDDEIDNIKTTLESYYEGLEFNFELTECGGFIIEIPKEIYLKSAALSWFLYVIRNQIIAPLLKGEEMEFLELIYEESNATDFYTADNLRDLINDSSIEQFRKSLLLSDFKDILKEEVHSHSGIVATFSNLVS